MFRRGRLSAETRVQIPENVPEPPGLAAPPVDLVGHEKAGPVRDLGPLLLRRPLDLGRNRPRHRIVLFVAPVLPYSVYLGHDKVRSNCPPTRRPQEWEQGARPGGLGAGEKK